MTGERGEGSPAEAPGEFVELAVLARAARSRSAEEFAAVYPAPGLLIELAGARQSSGGEERPQDGHLLTLTVRSVDFLPYLGRVGFLLKRPGNPFPRMISLGRTSSMDLVLEVRSISKFHGYFEESDGSWTYVDHDSTNGSWLNGQRLEGGERYVLATGDRLRFGLDVEAVFLPSGDLYRRVTRG